jgi:hypothetical protein
VSYYDKDAPHWMGGYLRCQLCGKMEKTKKSHKRICDKCYDYINYIGGAAIFVEDEIVKNKMLRIVTVAQELTRERLRRSEEK